MTIQLEEYANKKVILVHHQDSEDAVELEGTVSAASPVGIMIKPKGKTKVEIIEAANIEDIRLAPTGSPAAVRAARTLKSKQLKVIPLGQARAHLLERHGYKLAEVNALTEDQAFALHSEIDHVEQDLGHVHGETEPSEAELAVAEAEAKIEA